VSRKVTSLATANFSSPRELIPESRVP